jgi:predicted ATPase/class 3 adenylate cyclase
MAGLTGRGVGDAGLPTGRVAFLFTDVEASTRLLRDRPDRYPETMARQRELIEGSCAAGIRFGSAGDALFYAFRSTLAAVCAAAEAQRRLGGADVRVRMGVSVGDVQRVGGDYVGMELHRVARICSAANGGQVLLSAEAVALAGDLPSGLALLHLGRHRLKDFPEPQDLYRLVVDGVPSVSLPPRTEDGRVVALPRESSSLIGRDDDLVAVRALVKRERLVTLTGAGGSGKTRLARRIGWNVAPLVRGSVVFVAMAPFASTDMVAAEVGRLLGGEGTITSWELVARHFAQDEGLLILDNAEHLADAAVVVGRLLDRCGRLAVLVTSRVPLGAAGERLYTVEPLGIRDAVTLLVDRAQERGATIPPGEESADSLTRVAERLGGLPLAIELASARLRSLTPSGIAERLDRQLDLLADTRRVGDPRQQTIRSAIGWSYDLLEPSDQELFEALSVCAGPARLAMIAHTVEMDEFEALDGLTRLIDASLVRLASDGDEARYTMLEPIRQYAAELLATHGATADAERRMLRWYAEFAGRFEAPSGYDVVGADILRSDMPNVWRSLGYAAHHGLADEGVRLAFNTAHITAGLDGGGTTTRYLKDSAATPPTTTLGRSMRAILESEDEPYPGSLEKARLAAQLARASDSPMLLWIGLRDLTWTAFLHGELDTAHDAVDELPWARARSGWIALSLAVLSGTADAGDVDRFERDLRRAQSPPAIAAADGYESAALAVYLGDGDRALSRAEEAIELARGARVLATEQDARLIACTGALMVEAAADARSHAGRLLELRHRNGDSPDCPIQLAAYAVAGTLALLGDDAEAAVLAGAVTAQTRDWCRTPDVHRLGPAQRHLDRSRAALGDDRWAALAADGENLGLDEALRRAGDALSELP